MKTEAEDEMPGTTARAGAEPPPIQASVAGSVLRWAAAGSFFFTVCPALVFTGIFIDPRKNDAPQRFLSRTVVRLAGAQVEVRRSSGFNPQRTCFLICNHVNLFDPFVLYGVIPQFMRGLELESHFRIPVYGWLMKRFGNVPVPDVSRPSDLKRMWKLTRAALDSGVSLAVFPEGSRTLTGHVGEFHEGVFRMAQQFGAAITPVSIVGSFEFNRKTSWRLGKSKVVVHMHDTIETTGLAKEGVPELRERVRRIVAAPVEAHADEVEARARATRADQTSS